MQIVTIELMDKNSLLVFKFIIETQDVLNKINKVPSNHFRSMKQSFSFFFEMEVDEA